jgi:uncharacterized protein YggE
MAVAHVRGSSGVQVTPDRARLLITVRGEGRTDLAATESYSTALRLLGEVLDQHDLQPRIRAPHSWEMHQGNGGRVVAGEVSVEVDDLATVRLLGGYLAATQDVSLDRLQWLVSSWQEERRQARKAAVGSARAAAQDFADALGMEVEGIESISDPGLGEHFEDYDEEMAFAAASGDYEEQEGRTPTVDVSAPEPVTISATVHATYRLRPVG